MKAYCGSRISENMTRTPEGFLVCHNVPVARTGWQDYLAEEIGMQGQEIVRVYRSPEEVFSPATMASFEGKTVTNDHPPEEVIPVNATTYAKGHAQNVRRGDGGDADKLLADLVIIDASLIALIESGKREVSCGYECKYRETDGRIEQTDIRGNHVAVVDAGRAGGQVAIKDAAPGAPTKEGRKRNMSRNAKKEKKPSPLARLAAFMRDENVQMTPDQAEELVDIVDELAEEKAAADDEPEEAKDNEPAANETADNDPPPAADSEAMQKILDRLQAMDEKIDALSAGGAADDDPLEQLEKELQGEESVTLSPDEMPDGTNDSDESGTEDEEKTQDEEGPVMDPSDLPDNPIPNADKALKALREFKCEIANIKDPTQKRRMSDSAAKMVRAMYGMPSKKPGNNYAALMKQRQTNARRMKDAQHSQDASALGKKIMASRNPHYGKNQ